MRSFLIALLFAFPALRAQVTTTGFPNLPRAEAPGTLLSHPVTNGSEPIGRTTSINYLNGWIIVGAEAPGSRPGSDLVMRVYDISNPANPVRRLPSDFGLSYPNNSWIQGNYGWNAHGTAQSGNFLLPDVMRVNSFGGPVERGGTNGVPGIVNLPIGYNRSSQAGPWDATLLWYNSPDQDIDHQQGVGGPVGLLARSGRSPLSITSDHMAAATGIRCFSAICSSMARSGSAANDGVVVYRLSYQNFDDARSGERSRHAAVRRLAGGRFPRLLAESLQRWHRALRHRLDDGHPHRRGHHAGRATLPATARCESRRA